MSKMANISLWLPFLGCSGLVFSQIVTVKEIRYCISKIEEKPDWPRTGCFQRITSSSVQLFSTKSPFWATLPNTWDIFSHIAWVTAKFVMVITDKYGILSEWYILPHPIWLQIRGSVTLKSLFFLFLGAFQDEACNYIKRETLA